MKSKLRFVLFYHSLVSDWNHGNAHFLRGIVRELMIRGHEVYVFEPIDGWSYNNLVKAHGRAVIGEFYRKFVGLDSRFYDLKNFDYDRALDRADVVIVHEWNDPVFVAGLGQHRLHNNYLLFFHDTHHRSVTDTPGMARCDLSSYDGVLAYGETIRDVYLRKGWAGRAWVWHEAADTMLFRPILKKEKTGDLVWIGNWGDGERSAELQKYLLNPIRKLNLQAEIYGVRYPEEAEKAIVKSGATYRGWLPNYKVPEVFSKFSLTVHIPRRPYVKALPGIPTIRIFEALACGIPLICSPWSDTEGLFTPGKDFLVAKSGAEMERSIRNVLNDPDLARSLSAHGLRTILDRHTCNHRVTELLNICHELSGSGFSVAGIARSN